MPSLKKNQRFMTAKELIDRWQISELDLIAKLKAGEISSTDSEFTGSYSFEAHVPMTKHIDKMVFDLIEVERYEEKYPEFKPEAEPEPLDAKERREFGQLKREKEKWDLSLKAAIHIGIFLSDKDKGSVTRDMFSGNFTGDFANIESTTMEKICKAIPVEYRKRSGRPKKQSQN